MSYALPLAGSPQREMFAVEDLIAIEAGQFIPPSLPEARQMAREAFERYRGARIQPQRLIYIVLRGDDALELISIGRRGGWKREWRFGQFRYRPAVAA